MKLIEDSNLLIVETVSDLDSIYVELGKKRTPPKLAVIDCPGGCYLYGYVVQGAPPLPLVMVVGSTGNFKYYYGSVRPRGHRVAIQRNTTDGNSIYQVLKLEGI